MRLEIIYRKFEKKSERELILLLLEELKFNFKLDNLHERAGIYYCLGMIEDAYVYSYASCLRLNAKNSNIPQYMKDSITERKEQISKILEKKNPEFKLQFVCSVRNSKQYVAS